MNIIEIPEFKNLDASADFESPVLVGFEDTYNFAIQLEQSGFTNNSSQLEIYVSMSADPNTFQLLEVGGTQAVLTMASSDTAHVIEMRDPFLYDRMKIKYVANGNTGTITKLQISKKEVVD